MSDMTLLHFISTGNLSQTVSCPTWLHCVSTQQETFCKQFPVRHDSTAFHLYRKLFAYSFLSAMAPLCFTPAGNFLQTVSCPTWLHCVSHQQETFCIQFPIHHSSIVFQLDRKLFANGFLLGMALLCFTSVGNLSQAVSVRHDSTAFHLHRKPFANSFLSDMAPLRFTPAGNFSLTVSHSTWHHTYLASHLNLPKWPGRDKIEKYECM